MHIPNINLIYSQAACTLNPQMSHGIIMWANVNNFYFPLSGNPLLGLSYVSIPQQSHSFLNASDMILSLEAPGKSNNKVKYLPDLNISLFSLHTTLIHWATFIDIKLFEDYIYLFQVNNTRCVAKNDIMRELSKCYFKLNVNVTGSKQNLLASLFVRAKLAATLWLTKIMWLAGRKAENVCWKGFKRCVRGYNCSKKTW